MTDSAAEATQSLQRRPLPISPALRAQQAAELTRRITPLIGGRLRLTVTDNRAVMISVRRDIARKEYQVRLHHIFVDAPAAILGALGRYIELNDPVSSQKLGAFIDRNDHHISRRSPSRRAPRLVVRTAGRVYDLREIFDYLNDKYFEGRVEATITWGRKQKPARGGRRTIRLGSCAVEDRLIRIHSGLDQAWVPRFYIEWVVYHEMLHCVHPINVVKGRRIIHSPSFAADERRFEHHDQANTWEQLNLAALLNV